MSTFAFLLANTVSVLWGCFWVFAILWVLVIVMSILRDEAYVVTLIILTALWINTGIALIFLPGKDALIANEARSMCRDSADVMQCVQDTRKFLEETL